MLADFFVAVEFAPPTLSQSNELAGVTRASWSAAELAAVTARLATRGVDVLAGMSLERRLAAWNGAVAALLDPASEERRALFPALVETSRLSPEGLAEGLERVLGGASPEIASRLARRSLRTADSTRPDSYVAVVLAGNLPGLAVQSVLPALVAGRALLVKSSRSEPLFAPALLRALAEREPALAEAFAAVSFPGGELALEEAAFANAARVLAYGGDEAIGSLRARFGDRLVAQGPRASVALVGGAIDPVGVGRRLARDVALFDQRGCLSVQAVYTDGDARELAEALAFGLALEHGRLPSGPLDPPAAAAVQQLRGVARLEDRLVGELSLAQGTVLLAREPNFRPVPGLRTVRVHGVVSLESALAALAAWQGRLQGAALAGERALALEAPLAALGISRTAAAGDLQSADAAWANGGIDPMTFFDF